jgi:hypothetical protein
VDVDPGATLLILRPQKGSRLQLYGVQATLRAKRLTKVSAAFFARGILDGVEKCRSIAGPTPQLLRVTPNKSATVILSRARGGMDRTT